MSIETDTSLDQADEYKWGFNKPENYVFKSRKGLSHEIVEEISEMKGEPSWMREFRHKSLDLFLKRPMPTWGGDLSEIDFDNIYYYIKPTQEAGATWDDLPAEIKDTFEQLGIPEAERKYLAGVGAQYECLTGDSRVYTARGLVPIREIQPGDTVFSFDEETNAIIPAKVRATAEKGVRDVFEVKVGTRRIKATANHPFLAYSASLGSAAPQWTYLSDLSVGAAVAIAVDLHTTSTNVMVRTQSQAGGVQVLERPAALYTTEFHGYAKIEAITPASAEMVYDIEVDGPHNFVAEGLIVHNSEVVYHKVREDLEKLGVIFVDPGTALREHEELFRKYFATIIPPNDNKFAALNSAVWSGGSFIYIPKGVRVEIPLQAYFRINAQNMGQFERTLIIADEDSYVHYVEGCFIPGARVRTRNGEKPIEEVQVGDEVWTHKGRYRRVYHTMNRPYNGDIYHVSCFGEPGRELHITEEHPLLVVRGKDARRNDFTPAWLQASDVTVDDLLVAPIALADAHGASASHRDENFLYLPIRTIRVEPMETTVYNFSVEEDESYVAEGVISHNCTAPTYTSDSLHSAVVEIVVNRNARVRYTTIQNWSKNVYNLVTKRAMAYENATMEWVDGNIGSKLTMKYPAVWLMGQHARGEVLSVAISSNGQHQDAGGKIVHVAPNTSSQIISKSISKGTGRSSYRGLLKVQKGATGVKSNVRCDALLLDETSRTDTYPYIEIEEEDVEIGHEATVSKVGEEQLFYLMSRGLSEGEAYTMIVSGFIEPIAKELPLEYAVELNRLIQLEMTGSVG